MKKKFEKIIVENAINYIKKKKDIISNSKERNILRKVNNSSLEYIEYLRKLNEGQLKLCKKTNISGESLTLIIAGRCKDGVVIVADRRTMRGTEHSEEKKIHEYYNVVTAFAGLTGLKDKFLEMVEGVLRGTRALTLSEAIVGIEDTMCMISNRYKERLKGNAGIVALLSGLKNLTSGRAFLYHVFSEGYTEEINFLCIGHGAPYATCLAHDLYRPDLTMEKMAEIGIFVVSWVENVDSSVGGIPDVVFIKDEKGISDMDKDKVKTIYENSKVLAKSWSKLIPKVINNPHSLSIEESDKTKK